MEVLDQGFNPGSGREIHTSIKDRHGRAYIPGSSIKGALRTAAAFALVVKKGGKLYGDPEDLFREREEEEEGGGFKDVFKAIAVSDALPANPDDGVLQVVKSQRIGSKRWLINHWEIVPPGKKFVFTIKIHQGHSFAGEWASKTGLGSDPESILSAIFSAANDFSEAVVNTERKTLLKTKEKISRISDRDRAPQEALYRLADSFYQNSAPRVSNSSREAVLSMSRGTGKHRKTVRLAQPDGPRFMPITREVIAAPKYRDKPIFGWVMLRRV